MKPIIFLLLAVFALSVVNARIIYTIDPDRPPCLDSEEGCAVAMIAHEVEDYVDTFCEDFPDYCLENDGEDPDDICRENPELEGCDIYDWKF